MTSHLSRGMALAAVSAALVLVSCNKEEPETPAENVDQTTHREEQPSEKVKASAAQTSSDHAPTGAGGHATQTPPPAAEKKPAEVIVAGAVPSVTGEPEALAEEMAMIDDARDVWPTELLNGAGGSVLKKIAAMVEKHELKAEALAPIVDPAFSALALLPHDLDRKWEAESIHVERGEEFGSEQFSGIDGLIHVIEELIEPYHGGHVHWKFKIERITPVSENEAITRVIYFGMGDGDHGVIQQNAHWNVHWNVAEGMDKPKLLGIKPIDFEQITADHHLFADCTESALNDPVVTDVLSRGIDWWWGKIDIGLSFSLYGDYGLALGDFNNDGLDDIYVCQPGGLPNLLLRHNPDGTLTNVSTGSGVDLLNDTMNAVFADIDNDGKQDLLIALASHISLMRGNGQGQFEPAGILGTNMPTALSVVDYDGDSLLDVYICRYADSRSQTGSDSMFDSNKGLPNVLWKNEGVERGVAGGFKFRDVTEESGMNENNRRFSFAAVWEDYDNDGDMDVYVANDFGRNNLYRNDNGRFRDVAGEAGVEDRAAGMGVAWADFNQDGLMDLYVSNMFSSAGGRIAYQRNYAPGGVAGAADDAQYFARGNSLFQNMGDGTFRDVSLEAGVTMGRWAWGAEFMDFNNDGLADIFVPNGFITNHSTKDL